MTAEDPLLVIDIPPNDREALRPLFPREATQREQREFERDRKEIQPRPTDTQELRRE